MTLSKTIKNILKTHRIRNNDVVYYQAFDQFSENKRVCQENCVSFLWKTKESSNSENWAMRVWSLPVFGRRNLIISDIIHQYDVDLLFVQKRIHFEKYSFCKEQYVGFRLMYLLSKRWFPFFPILQSIIIPKTDAEFW